MVKELGDDTAPAAEVMAAASRRLRARSYLYFELEGSAHSGIAVSVRHHPSKDAALGDYEKAIYARDPLTLTFRRWLLNGDAASHGPSIVALGELPRLDRVRYESSFLHRAGIDDVIGLGVPVSIGGQARVLCFGFHRGGGDPSFTSSDARILMRLAEGLRLRGENLALREASSVQVEVSRLLADESGRDWALLDERLQIRQASVANGLFRDAGGLEEAREALRGHLARGAADRTIARTLFRSGPQGTGLVALRVAAGSGTWWLVRPEPQIGLVPDGIFDVAGLTGREREMMRLLVNGRSNPELARDLAITVNTVENHLRSIYAKLEVTSRGQAVARLLGPRSLVGDVEPNAGFARGIVIGNDGRMT